LSQRGKLPKPLTCPTCRKSIEQTNVVDWSKELMMVDKVELMKKVPRFYIGGIFKDTRTQFERLCCSNQDKYAGVNVSPKRECSYDSLYTDECTSIAP